MTREVAARAGRWRRGGRSLAVVSAFAAALACGGVVATEPIENMPSGEHDASLLVPEGPGDGGRPGLDLDASDDASVRDGTSVADSGPGSPDTGTDAGTDALAIVDGGREAAAVVDMQAPLGPCVGGDTRCAAYLYYMCGDADDAGGYRWGAPARQYSTCCRDPRFQRVADDTVLDTKTGRTWWAYSTNEPTRAAANAACGSFFDAGLPTTAELLDWPSPQKLDTCGYATCLSLVTRDSTSFGVA